MEPWMKTGLAILDIALVYYIFLRLLRLVRGTRAGAVLVGILIVLAAWLVARQLGLVAMGNLLDRFIDSLVIILVVVFQADIRRAGARAVPRGVGDVMAQRRSYRGGRLLFGY